LLQTNRLYGLLYLMSSLRKPPHKKYKKTAYKPIKSIVLWVFRFKKVPKSGKFAGRGFCGYAFSQFISTELGYDYYGHPKFKDNISGNTQEISQQGFDLIGKATLPLDYGFGFYIKGGVAWVHRSALNNNGGNFANKAANSKITPVGALGVNYWFIPNIAADLSWTKTMTVGNLPTTDLIALGLTYKINI